MTGSRPKCVLVLTVWLVGITFAGFAVAPGLSRISYPQPLDLLVLAFIPVGAFHAAKYAKDQLIFLLYGCLASTAFAFNFTIGQGRIGLTMMYHPEQGFSLVVVASIAMLGFGFLCRAMPGIRERYQNCRRFPLGCCEHCGYNLTGNVSGTCPECGRTVMRRNDQP
ncbi:MAG TPA: hypothetical protein PL151_04100 [Phycisphaerae bacterium]|nr:hypothetical protein [Phycisphaerae bacterium]HOJ75732.1 hypothetical protein [Phycisphaerae bacterium]HOM51398.1 hypothetical protein [Phycisphaerae bacterium]HON68507.1 hypothetical protein [Phycisphaerae bacterium]HOQ88080.1 hypothetical protein [Phycisphaerae bacterium]